MAEREIKLQEYGKKVFGLKAYTYFWLPLLFISTIYSVFSHVTSWNGSIFHFILSLFAMVIAALSLMSIRWIDKFSFYFNVALLSLMAIRDTVSYVMLLVSMGSLSQQVQGAIQPSGNSAYDAGQQIGASLVGFGTGFVMFGAVVGLLCSALFFGIFFYMFFKHRKLFFI